ANDSEEKSPTQGLPAASTTLAKAMSTSGSSGGATTPAASISKVRRAGAPGVATRCVATDFPPMKPTASRVPRAKAGRSKTKEGGFPQALAHPGLHRLLAAADATIEPQRDLLAIAEDQPPQVGGGGPVGRDKNAGTAGPVGAALGGVALAAVKMVREFRPPED